MNLELPTPILIWLLRFLNHSLLFEVEMGVGVSVPTLTPHSLLQVNPLCANGHQLLFTERGSNLLLTVACIDVVCIGLTKPW